MVETRRTSRRLQAKATGTSPSPSPMSSPVGRVPIRKSRRTPSPRSRAKKAQDETETAKQEEAQDETETAKQEEAQEIPVVTDEEEKETQVETTGQATRVEAIEVGQAAEKDAAAPEEEEEEIILLDDNEDAQENQLEVVETEQEEDKVEAPVEIEEEEIMLLDDVEEEEEDDDEDIDQYASIAASGLNLSTKSAASTSAVSAKPSAASVLKRRLVPNQLDSGASQYQEFFNFAGSKRSQAATLRADARAAEEAKVLAAGQKAVAHSDRQRAESQYKKSAGRRWFNFESEEMTDDARRDFALLRMRNYLDPKKFYKTSDHTRALPKHFQMGVVIEGAHEFHSARLTKKQRRKTFTDEIMADEAIVQYTNRVAGNIQKARSNQGRKKRRRN
ncbi:rRNA-processing protein fcf2 [Phytophthora nicotianae]|uniref:rRNA-processing protein fcf2 n=2 Tax=Phytophthora nicotianae TaxID=4792 RepID=A0A0W8CGV3_PHYNI|nr:rRNA-processing protein fcf2 [Phytophthora nicotianae]